MSHLCALGKLQYRKVVVIINLPIKKAWHPSRLQMFIFRINMCQKDMYRAPLINDVYHKQLDECA